MPRRHEDETPDERLDRNWSELLQELRVAQTGVQILTGFLLTLPFTQRFGELDRAQEIVYLVTLSGSVLATGLLVAPVALHRVLFRQGLRPWLVDHAHGMAQAGLAALAFTIVGVVWFVFDVVLGSTAALVAAVVTLLFYGTVWGAVPLFRRRHPPHTESSGAAPPDPSTDQEERS